MKTVYGWLIEEEYEWSYTPYKIELFFSSKKKYEELVGRSIHVGSLVKVEVPDNFTDLDYVPDNY